RPHLNLRREEQPRAYAAFGDAQLARTADAPVGRRGSPAETPQRLGVVARTAEALHHIRHDAVLAAVFLGSERPAGVANSQGLLAQAVDWRGDNPPSARLRPSKKRAEDGDGARPRPGADRFRGDCR